MPRGRFFGADVVGKAIGGLQGLAACRGQMDGVALHGLSVYQRKDVREKVLFGVCRESLCRKILGSYPTDKWSWSAAKGKD